MRTIKYFSFKNNPRIMDFKKYYLLWFFTLTGEPVQHCTMKVVFKEADAFLKISFQEFENSVNIYCNS